VGVFVEKTGKISADLRVFFLINYSSAKGGYKFLDVLALKLVELGISYAIKIRTERISMKLEH
jgi:hypothetical protein